MVYATGRPERGAHVPIVPNGADPGQTTWYTFSYSALFNEESTFAGAFIVATDTSEKAREVAGANAGRQALLLSLSDVLGPLGDSLEIQSAALRVLG